LAGGQLLTGDDVAKVDLSACRLVVLSACGSALIAREIPDELIGLPASFLASGARSVIASLWPVGEVATLLLMHRLYGLLAQGQEPAMALHHAQTWLRHATSNELASVLEGLQVGPERAERQRDLIRTFRRGKRTRRYSHPVFWGGFAHFGPVG
jgi:CHAT domain-containing protein